MKDQSKRREELIEFRQVLPDERLILVRYSRPVHVTGPFDEDGLRLIAETEVRGNLWSSNAGPSFASLAWSGIRSSDDMGIYRISAIQTPHWDAIDAAITAVAVQALSSRI
jgi:hypothetical protein